MTLIIIKLIALAIAIMYGITILGNLRNKHDINGWVVFLEAISLATFLVLQFKLYQ